MTIRQFPKGLWASRFPFNIYISFLDGCEFYNSKKAIRLFPIISWQYFSPECLYSIIKSPETLKATMMHYKCLPWINLKTVWNPNQDLSVSTQGIYSMYKILNRIFELTKHRDLYIFIFLYGSEKMKIFIYAEILVFSKTTQQRIMSRWLFWKAVSLV